MAGCFKTFRSRVKNTMLGYCKFNFERFCRIPKRIVKELRYLKTRKILRDISAKEFLPIPEKVGIATSTICNANCVFCGYQYVDKDRKKIMPEEVFLHVVKEIVRLGVKRVDLTPTVGDPLVDKKILEKVKVLNESGVDNIIFSTNGIAINSIGARKLIKGGPKYIHISTSGFDRDEFKMIYRKDKYDDVISGIKNLLEENRKQENKCEITISVISSSPKRKVLSRADAVRLMDLGAKISFTRGIDNWNGSVSDTDLPFALKPQMRKLKRRKGPCHCLYDGPVVFPDGNVSACHSRDINQSPEMHLGNILEDDLSVIHQRTLEIIDRWHSGVIPGICKACKVYSEPRLEIVSILEDFQKAKKVNT